jgi:hypothetical protein
MSRHDDKPELPDWITQLTPDEITQYSLAA